MRGLAILLLLLLASCDMPAPTGPTPDPSPTCTATNVDCEFGVDFANCQCNPRPEDPIVQGPMVDMNNLWGFSAFRMPETSQQQQRQDLRFAKRRGYTMVRLCAETTEWGL